MYKIKQINIFESVADAIVVPVSTDGEIQKPYYSGLAQSGTIVVGKYEDKEYNLGDIEIIPIISKTKFKYLIKACVASEDGTGRYASIRQIGINLALMTNNKEIHSISIPPLGDTCRLDNSYSANILINAFLENDNQGRDIILCINKQLPNAYTTTQDFSVNLVLNIELPEVLNSDVVQNIIYDDNLYFEKAYEVFRHFENYKIAEEALVELENVCRNNSSFSFIHILKQFKGNEMTYNFLELCGELISYIDIKAPFNKRWNRYQDHRTISMTTLMMYSWLIGLLQYKKCGTVKAIKSTTVQNAILHLQYPEDYITTLSCDHRRDILSAFTNKTLHRDCHRQNGEIISFFRKLKIYPQNPKNKGALYNAILYHPEIKVIWGDAKRTPTIKKDESQSDLKHASDLIYESVMSGNKQLDLGCCGITDLDALPELYDCGHLEELILSNEWAEYDESKEQWTLCKSNNTGKANRLTSLTIKLGNLKNLKRLICGGDWNNSRNIEKWGIRNLNAISKLTKLEFLNVSNNQIKSLSGIEKLQHLKVVHLNNNLISQISQIAKLKMVVELYLSNNKITTISHLSELKNITTLDLHGNIIKTLDTIKVLIDRLGISNTKWEPGIINIAKNPLTSPPMDFVDMGKTGVLQYFEQMKTAKTAINKDIKVVLVGNSEVGKTTLLKYLEQSDELKTPHPATMWMEEKVIISQSGIAGLGKCTLRVFDFGGHDYYHDTHHLFFSTNTIYIYLWESASMTYKHRKLQQEKDNKEKIEVETVDYPIDYWLDSIKYYTLDKVVSSFDDTITTSETYSSSVLVVQNKISSRSDIIFLDEASLHKRFPFIFDFAHVSIKEEYNMQYFDTLFNESLSNMNIIGSKIPQFYNKVKNKIANYKGDPVISFSKFIEFCQESSGLDISNDQCVLLAKYLKQIGVILWDTNMADAKVYIKKDWIIRKIHSVLEDMCDKKGEFDREYIENKLGDQKYVMDVITVMLNFNMIFKHPQKDVYIAPLYLPNMPSHIINMFLPKKLIPYRRFEYSGYIKKHIVLCLFQEYGSRILYSDDGAISESSYYYWRDALILKNPDSDDIVMIKLCDDTFIDVYKVKCDTNDFANNIISYLRNLNQGYDTEELVTLDGEDYISLEILNNNAKNGSLVFSETRVNKETEAIVNPKLFNIKDYQMFLEQTIKKKKVVISYSKRDLVQVNTLLRYLKPLEANDLIEKPWCCTRLEAGDDWDKEIETKFKDADVVLFMISENFYETDYIIDHEIKNTIDRYVADKNNVKIIPIILEFYDWKRKEPYNLQKFSALPYQCKPISDYDNKNMAWHMVAKSIQMVIEKDLNTGNKGAIEKELLSIYERQVAGKLDNNSN